LRQLNERDPAIAAIGECMVELAPASDALFRLGYGGDTLNTSVMLARLDCSVRYVTALGDDPFSARMLAGWHAEGIDVSAVVRLAGRMPGLYAIELDEAGERSFHYWRGEAAARDLVSVVDFRAALADAAVAYFSGITLAVTRPQDRQSLIERLQEARQAGCRIAFDMNVRARLWRESDDAMALFAEAVRGADIVFATAEDLANLGLADDVGGADAWLRQNVRGETIFRVSREECRVRTKADGATDVVPLTYIVEATDTTGAGDSFNAGYLAARLKGAEPKRAVAVGHRVAAVTVQHQGAIPPRAAADWTRLIELPADEGGRG